MKVINLTPHPITIHVVGNGVNAGEERNLTIPSSGLARLESQDRPDGPGYLAVDEPAEWPDGGNFDVTERTFGDITGLPEPAELTIYVVSLPVAQRAAELGRTDVYAPDSGPTAIRDANGQVKAVRGLVRFRRPERLRLSVAQVEEIHRAIFTAEPSGEANKRAREAGLGFPAEAE